MMKAGLSGPVMLGREDVVEKLRGRVLDRHRASEAKLSELFGKEGGIMTAERLPYMW